MSQGPRRLIEDPDWGGAFEGLLEEHGRIERLPDNIRSDVAAMVAASVAGAVGVAAVGVAASSIASTSGTLATASSGGVAVSSAAAGVGTASAAAGGVALGSGVAASSGVAAAGAGLASSVGAVSAVTSMTAVASMTAVGSLGAASASLAALGIVPKVILGLSLAGAVTVGGVAVVNNAPTQFSEREAATVSVQAGAEVEKGRNAWGALGKRKTEAPLRDSVEKPEGSAAADGSGAEQDAEALAKSDEGSPPAGPKPVVATGLAGEVSLLQRARAALSVNREYAWTLLNEYHRRYPQGALRSEYEVLVRRVQTVPNDASQPKAEEGSARAP